METVTQNLAYDTYSNNTYSNETYSNDTYSIELYSSAVPGTHLNAYFIVEDKEEHLRLTRGIMAIMDEIVQRGKSAVQITLTAPDKSSQAICVADVFCVKTNMPLMTDILESF